MRVKRIICMVLACIAIVVAISVPANAAEIEVIALENSTGKFIAPFATRSFNISIPAKSQRTVAFLWLRGKRLPLRHPILRFLQVWISDWLILRERSITSMILTTAGSFTVLTTQTMNRRIVSRITIHLWNLAMHLLGL